MKNIVKLFRRIDQDFPFFSLKICAFSIIVGVLPLINIFAPKLIIEAFQTSHNISFIGQILALVLVLNTINVIMKEYYDTYFNLVFEAMTDKLLFELSEKSIRLPIEESDSKLVQDKLEAAHDSVFDLFGLYENLYMLSSALVTGLIAVFVLIRLNILLPILGLAIVFVNRIFVRLLKENELFRQKSDIPDNRIYRYFIEFSQDYKYSKDLKIYEGEEMILEKSKGFMDSMIKRSSLYFNRNGLYTGAMNIISNFGIIGALFYLTKRMVEKTISLGDFTLYFNSIIQLINTLNLLEKNYASLISINEKLNAYFDFMNLKERFDANKPYKKIEQPLIKVEFDHVYFKYPKSENYILKDLSFTIEEGETVALVGKNGAGKSTIVKLLCKFYEPTKGSILINGVNLEDLKTSDYYKILSPTFQDFRLFPFKLSENISGKKSSAITDAEISEIYESLKLLGIYDWVKKTPKGLDTYITTLFDDKGIEPSGGIGQKIALSRSMVHKGKFYIMDEPTSALDPRSEEDIFENMLEISKGHTSLFISHRLSSTRYADRIIVCDDGHIIENGNHKELMETDGLYKKMFETQAQLYIDD
ncbi:MAG: ABC transporter ATP-binding protein [Peptoniphilaceae bacterium]|nr:ABC transporter ATP-binding protein [Peptoniphilaceae bacterium]MDY6019152.1 ABC transporter ATP-binding protein [Anaerococcus sp.]